MFTLQASKTVQLRLDGIVRIGRPSLALQVEETSCNFYMLLGCLEHSHLSSVLGSAKASLEQGPVPPPRLPRPQSRSTSSCNGFVLWNRVKKSAWEHMKLKQQNWSTGHKNDTQPLQAQNQDSSWSPLATLVCHKLISRLVLQEKHVAIGLSTFVKFLSAWFWIWHVHWSVKSSNLFCGLNFREVSWWQDAAGLNSADVELLDGSVSSNRFGLGEPLGKSVKWSLETWWRSVEICKEICKQRCQDTNMPKKYLNWIYEYEWDSLLC